MVRPATHDQTPRSQMRHCMIGRAKSRENLGSRRRAAVFCIGHNPGSQYTSEQTRHRPECSRSIGEIHDGTTAIFDAVLHGKSVFEVF